MNETRIEFAIEGLPEAARIYLAGMLSALADPSAAITVQNGVVTVRLDDARPLNDVRGLLSRTSQWLRSQGVQPTIRLVIPRAPATGTT